jgi:hypothetical protein
VAETENEKATPEEIAAALNADGGATLRQAIAIVSDVCAAYIGSLQAEEDKKKELHQMAVSILLFDIAKKTKYPKEMAVILRAIADDLEHQS